MSGWLRRVIAERGKVSGRIADEKCENREKVECACEKCEKVRVEVEQAEGI